MRQELENIKNIEEYLMGKLNKAEKDAFEKRMSEDKSFAKDVENQKVLIDRIQTLALKKSVHEAHKRNASSKGGSWTGKIITSIIILAIVTGGILFLIISNTDDETFSINPPITGIDVPFIHNKINGSKATVLNFKSGSSVFIPQNAFIDEKGNSVEGYVDINFREFKDAIDICLAGIPMNYNKNGKRFHFESAGMSEIYASKNGAPLKLAEGKNIEFVQKSYTTSDAFNLYRFDTTKGKWINKGKDLPVNGIELAIEGHNNTNNIDKSRLPVKPRKAKSSGLQMELHFNPNDFPELAGFKGVLFEVDEKASPYRKGDQETLWEDVKIVKGDKHGSYRITLLSETEGKKTNYVVYPVYEGDDLKNAQTLYDKKLDQYNKRLAQKKEKEKEKKLAFDKEQRRIDSVNKAIEARNALRRKKRREADSISALRKAQYKEIQETQLLKTLNTKRVEVLRSRFTKQSTKDKLVFDVLSKDELMNNQGLIEKSWNYINSRYSSSQKLSAYVYRTYEVNNFGIWNTDIPERLPKGRILNATFRAENTVDLYTVSLIDKNMRSVFRYPAKNYKRFRFNPNSNNVIWGLNDDQILYFNEFTSIPNGAKEYTFNLETIDGPFESYEEVRKILEEL